MLALSLLAWQRSPGSQPRVSWRQGLASMHDWRRGKAGPMGSRYGKCSFVRIIRMRSSSSVCVCVWAWLPMACWGPHLHAPSCLRRSMAVQMVHCSYAGRGRRAEGGWRLTTGDDGLLAAGTVAPHTLRARQRPPRRLHTYYMCVRTYSLSVRVSPQKTVPSSCPCAHAHDADDIHARRPSIGSPLTPTCTLQIFPVHHTHWPLVRPLAHAHAHSHQA